MKILNVTASEVSTAIPSPFPKEGRFAFFHGPADRNQAGKYCLRLGSKGFPLDREQDWTATEYDLVRAHPSQDDQFGNPVYVLRQAKLPASRECLCFLDMRPARDGTAILFNWNAMTMPLGKGIGQSAAIARPKRGGARRAAEVEYPVLLCQAGAQFSWARYDFYGREENFRATWDGAAFRVRHPSAITYFLNQARPAGAPRLTA